MTSDVRHARAFAGAAAWTLGADLVSKVSLFAAQFLVLRVETPRQFGLFVALQATALLAAGAWDFGLSTALTRAISAGEAPSLAIRTATRLRCRILPIWGLAFGLAALPVMHVFPVTASLVAPTAVLSLLISANLLCLAGLRGQMLFRSCSLALLTGRVALLLSIALGAQLFPDLQFFMWALVLGEAATLVLLAARLLKTRSAISTPEKQSEISLRAASPFAASSIMQIAYNRVDTLIVAGIASAQVVSAYAPASRLQDALYIVPTTLSVVALPFLARHYREGIGVSTQMTLATGGAVAVSVAIAAIVAALAPWLVLHLFGTDYAQATLPIQIIVWSIPLVALNSGLFAAVTAGYRSSYVPLATGTALVCSVLLNLLLTPRYGAAGASIAATIREIPVSILLAIGAFRGGLLRRHRALSMRPA